jgi:hypothetical protein
MYDPYLIRADIMKGRVVYIKKADISGWRDDEHTELTCVLMKDGSYHMVEDRDDERSNGLIFPHEFRVIRKKS